MSTVIVIPYRSDYSTPYGNVKCEMVRSRARAHATCVPTEYCVRGTLSRRGYRGNAAAGAARNPGARLAGLGMGLGLKTSVKTEHTRTRIHTISPSIVARAECGKTKERKRTHRFTHHEFRFFWEKIRGCREELMVSPWPVDAERVRPLLLLRTDN